MVSRKASQHFNSLERIGYNSRKPHLGQELHEHNQHFSTLGFFIFMYASTNIVMLSPRWILYVKLRNVIKFKMAVCDKGILFQHELAFRHNLHLT